MRDSDAKHAAGAEWSPREYALGNPFRRPRVETVETYEYGPKDVHYPLPESNGYRSHSVTLDEVIFLRALTEHYNRHLGLQAQSYERVPIELPHNRFLLEPFRDVISIESLANRGLLKRHQIGNRGAWYSATPDGQAAAEISCRSGMRVGDPGEDMPHRLAVELTARYFAGFTEVRKVYSYEPLFRHQKQHARIDVAAFDSSDNLLHVAEIEMGTPRYRQDNRVGTNDPAEIVGDYRKMLEMASQKGGNNPVQTWWICQSKRVAERILTHLMNQGLGLTSVSKAGFPAKRRRLSEQGPFPGINNLYSLSEIWSALDTGEPLPP